MKAAGRIHDLQVRRQNGGTRPHPRVSVIIAAYNCAPYLSAAIESALGQSETDLEIVVVDDASTDGTPQVAERYATSDKVRLFRNESNQGVGFSRNRGIREAQGEWIVQLDADDWLAPDRVATLLAYSRSVPADIVADDQFIIDNDTLAAVSTRFIDNGISWNTVRRIDAIDLVRFDMGSIKPLLRKSFIVEHGLLYPESVRYGEDFVFLLHAMLSGAVCILVPKPMYHLRRGNTDSLTTQRIQLLRQIEESTIRLMADEEISAVPGLLPVLHARLVQVRRLSIMTCFVQMMKNGQVAAAGINLLASPSVLAAVISRLLEMPRRGMRRLLRRHLLQGASAPPDSGALQNV